ncbi:hypothetical protein FKB34_13215 [Glycocaulis profundi]|nr:hypothetical protein FKB34_13215 [Glycocaulis profundi]
MRLKSLAGAAALLAVLPLTSHADEPGAPRGDRAEAAAAGEPLVIDIPGERDATVAIEITSMEEVGELLRIGVTFTPEWETEPFGGRDADLAQTLGANLANRVTARLIDPVNLLEYQQAAGGTGGQRVPMSAGTPRTVYFYFGLPVEEMETFDLYLDAAQVGLPPLVDIPYRVE